MEKYLDKQNVIENYAQGARTTRQQSATNPPLRGILKSIINDENGLLE
jgi:hypothetical protein